MKKERLEIRLSSEEKLWISERAKEKNINTTQYLLDLTAKDLPPHSQKIQNLQLLNAILNVLNCYKNIPLQAKEEIIQEAENYAKY